MGKAYTEIDGASFFSGERLVLQLDLLSRPQSQMPRIAHRHRAPDTAIDPKDTGSVAESQSMQELLAKILPQPGTLDFQEISRFAEQILSPKERGEVGRDALALAAADLSGTPAPPEAVSLLQSLAGAAIAPMAFKMLRTQFGASQQEIAQACGVTRGTVISWEQGESSLPPQAILSLIRLVATRTTETKILTGNDIISLRHALGLSQPRFAETIGVAPLTIFNWEKRGDRPLPRSASIKVREQHSSALAKIAAAA